jgi:hypothetical protein
MRTANQKTFRSIGGDRNWAILHQESYVVIIAIIVDI